MLTGRDYPAGEFASVYAEQGFGGLDYGWDDGPDFERCLTPSISFNCLNQYTQCGTMRMVRRDNWKLVYDMQGRGQLHNLAEDPGELVDRFDDPACRDVRGALVEELLTLTLRAQDPLPLPGGDCERKSRPGNYWCNEG